MVEIQHNNVRIEIKRTFQEHSKLSSHLHNRHRVLLIGVYSDILKILSSPTSQSGSIVEGNNFLQLLIYEINAKNASIMLFIIGNNKKNRV